LSLTIGAQLGTHELLGLLGKGGMGEVYRALDTKLKREVAIKILPDELSRDPDRLSRFQREAEMLASLNHPNIAAIYDLQEARGSHFLVLELVEGKTLAEHISGGPMPLGQALRTFAQVAEGLLAAHRHGIIHRDLKPPNIMISAEGRVKLLDFGLAKSIRIVHDPKGDPNARTVTVHRQRGDGRPDAESQVPTLSVSLTQAGTSDERGVILGTPAYMSPEQVLGRKVDTRADIWAFGCCLFEALTATRIFTGGHARAILQSVLQDEPDWSLLDAAPIAIRELTRHCLARDSDARPRDFAEVRSYLHEPSAGLEQRLFDLTPDLLCVADFDGMFRRVNPAFERALGWSQEELEGRPFRDFIHPNDVEPTLAEFLRLSTTGQPTISFENRYRCADGRFVRLQWMAQPESESGLIYAVARLVVGSIATSETILPTPE
jgi:PAS domain S-box-containing protein